MTIAITTAGSPIGGASGPLTCEVDFTVRLTCVASGGVNSGDEEPYSATSGRFSAAATCMRPESLVTTTSAPLSRSIASASCVWPQRLSAALSLHRAISAPMAIRFCFGSMPVRLRTV